MTQYVALTAYDVPVVQAPLPDRKAALEWADRHGARWPGGRIVQITAKGRRTIWRQDSSAREAGGGNAARLVA